MYVIRKNKTLRKLNISINKLSEELGAKIVSALTENNVIRDLDIRGANISHKTKRTIDGIVLENREKNNTVELNRKGVKEPDPLPEVIKNRSNELTHTLNVVTGAGLFLSKR